MHKNLNVGIMFKMFAAVIAAVLISGTALAVPLFLCYDKSIKLI